MRQYRGKRIDNGEWVSGCYLTQRSNDGLKHMISVQDMWAFHEVDPKTVGQSTGESDDKGKEIYDGDIFRDSEGELWRVFYEDGQYLAKGGAYDLVESLMEFVPDYCTIISNIHDNPELLGEEVR